MPSPADADALSRIADELAAIRQSLAALTAENAALRARVDDGDRARADLQAQTEHLLDLLADSRRQLRELWQK